MASPELLEDRAAPSGGLLEILLAVSLFRLHLSEYRDRTLGVTAEDLSAAAIMFLRRSSAPTRERLQTLSLAFEEAMNAALRVAQTARQGNVDQAFEELATARDKVEELVDQLTQTGGTFGKFSLRGLAQTLDWVDELLAAARARKLPATDPATAAGGTSSVASPAALGSSDAANQVPASPTGLQSSPSDLASPSTSGPSVSVPTGTSENLATPADLQSPSSDFQSPSSDPLSGGGGGMSPLSGANQNPVAVDDSQTTPEDTPITVNVLDNDSDPDGNHIFITAAGPAAHGKVTFTASTVTYRPALNYYGPDLFTYTITDGHFNDQGQLGAATASVSLTVTPADDYPTARDDYTMTSQSAPLLIDDVLANDFDPEGVVNVASVQSYPWTMGTITNNGDNTITYDPRMRYPDGEVVPGMPGRDQFMYWLADSTGQQSVADVYVYVTDDWADDWPWIVEDEGQVDEDGSITIDVLPNDLEPEGPLVLTSAGPAAAEIGTVEMIFNAQYPNGAARYTPPADYWGGAYFAYEATDVAGQTDIANVWITINPVNDPPVAADDYACTFQGQSVRIEVLSNDTDVDNDNGELIVTNMSRPVSGTAWFDDRTVTYTPNANATVTSEVLQYWVADGHGGVASAYIYVSWPVVDIDTDSDNTGYVEQTSEEDTDEMLDPGKVLRRNHDDDNGN